MQVATVIVGDPNSVRDQLNALAVNNQIQEVFKTISSGSFIVLYDDNGSASQTVETLQGDPQSIVDQVNALVGGGSVINVLTNTFSSSYYLVVYV